jgi:hypothetical protein
MIVILIVADLVLRLIVFIELIYNVSRVFQQICIILTILFGAVALLSHPILDNKRFIAQNRPSRHDSFDLI